MEGEGVDDGWDAKTDGPANIFQQKQRYGTYDRYVDTPREADKYSFSLGKKSDATSIILRF